MTVDIVRLAQDRWREYRDIRLEALRSEPGAFGSSTEEEEKLTEDDWRERVPNAFFAVSGGRVVGMIVCVFGERVKTRHVADIFGVYVTAGSRGEGAGTMLLKKALSEAGKRGVIKVRLAVNPRQEAAVRMYERAGFSVVGRARKELKVGRRFYDELYMEKLL